MFLVIILVFSLPLTCKYLEQPYKYYETYSIDIHDGGWVPHIFPNDVSKIYVAKNIDTNEVWVKFTKGKKPINNGSFQQVPAQKIKELKYRKPFLASWWFEGIIEQQPANDSALYATFYKGSCSNNMVAYLAISKTENINYWWCQDG